MHNKRNKSVIFAGAFLLAVMTAGCGQTASDTEDTTVETVSVMESQALQTVESTEAEQAQEAEVTKEDFQIMIGETAIEIGGDMIAYQEVIGEPDSYSAAKSCLGSGEDKTFIYGETAIYTKPIDDKDKIYLIEVTGGSKLPCGIGVGSSIDEVESIFGICDDVEGTEYLYTMDDLTIGFDMDNKIVSFIEIFGEE